LEIIVLTRIGCPYLLFFRFEKALPFSSDKKAFQRIHVHTMKINDVHAGDETMDGWWQKMSFLRGWVVTFINHVIHQATGIRDNLVTVVVGQYRT